MSLLCKSKPQVRAMLHLSQSYRVPLAESTPDLPMDSPVLFTQMSHFFFFFGFLFPPLQDSTNI